jgi:hypothetical protein
MDTYTEYSKHLYKTIDMFNKNRAKSATSLKIKGINYKFMITDLCKYNDKLKYGKFDFP